MLIRQQISAVLVSIGFGVTFVIRATAAPLFSGNAAIANTFLHGDAHVLIVGDSLQNSLKGYYPAAWKVDHWSGQGYVAAANSGQSGAFTFDTFNYDGLYSSNTDYSPNDTPPDGLTAISPATSHHIVFTGAAAGPADPSVPLLSNRLYEAGLTPNQGATYASGKWADTNQGQLHVGILTYANPNGVAPGSLEFVARINSLVTPVATIPLVTQSNTSGLVSQSATFNAEAWQGTNSLTAAVRMIPGQAPAAGSNLIVAGVRYWSDQPGFQMSSIALGGQGVDYFLNPAVSTDANLKAYVDFTDSNIAYIWLGQNDTGNYDAATWKSKMLALVARYKAARPGMEFVLVSTYDTGNPVLADYAEALSQIAVNDPDHAVLFLNLFKSAGNFATLDANYLADHVHENAAGNTYFANQTEALLEQAAAAAPEPTCLSLILIAGAGLLGRRRRGTARG